MKIYVVEFENDRHYEDYEHYMCIVFDQYEKAVAYCLSKGYEKTEIKNLFKKKYGYWNGYLYLEILEIEMNKEMNEAE